MTEPSRRRVVVTGLGAVCSWGWSVDSLRRGLATGRTAIGAFSRFPNDAYPTHVAAEVPEPFPRLARDRTLSVADRFALASAAEAIAQAGLPDDLATLDVGVYFGSSTGGMEESESFYADLRREPRDRMPLRRLVSQEVSGPGDAVARAFRVCGPVQTFSSACASATLAVGIALDALRTGEVDVAVVGGADSLCRVTYGGFNALRSVDPAPSRPFRADRAGLSLGEGGATVVLETLESAEARGAKPLAELLGAGATADAHHMTAPHPDGHGAAAALAAALDDAALEPAAVDFVNAHGTGTPLNDVAETRALRAVLGDRALRLPVTANKASIGHLLGSAGAIEAVVTVLSLVEQRIPATPGDGPIDPEAAVDLVVEERRGDFRVGVSLNLAFGGCNAALVFGRWERS